MRLFEYQAKRIFQKFGIPVPKSQVTSNAALAEQIRDEIGNGVVVKAQVLTRGRAKVGGIRLVYPKDDIADAATKILGLSINNNKVRKILIEEVVRVQKEYFIRVEIDPNLEKPVFIASKFEVKKSLTNGMEATENRIRVPIDLSLGLLDHQIRKAAVTLEIGWDLWDKFSLILTGIWKIFREMDAEFVEINPLVLDESNQLVALGAVIELDECTQFRHAEILEKREPTDESLLKVKAEKFGISLLQNGGNIGCIVNGAALGYAIGDMLKSLDSQIGILLDVGDGAGDEKISAGLDILFRNKKTDCILIAIFGGLTRCDKVANGILKSLANTSKIPSVVVYLNGTYAEFGKPQLKRKNLFVEETLIGAIKKCLEIIKNK